MPLINQVPVSFYKGWREIKTASIEKKMLIALILLIGIIALAAWTGYTDLEGIR